MSVNINDFKIVPAKLSFNGGVFRKLQTITFFLEDAAYAVITNDESVHSKTTEFKLAIAKSLPVILIQKDAAGHGFEIWENG